MADFNKMNASQPIAEPIALDPSVVRLKGSARGADKYAALLSELSNIFTLSASRASSFSAKSRLVSVSSGVRTATFCAVEIDVKINRIYRMDKIILKR